MAKCRNPAYASGRPNSDSAVRLVLAGTGHSEIQILPLAKIQLGAALIPSARLPAMGDEVEPSMFRPVVWLYQAQGGTPT
jgi:hypothetical protein